MQMIPDTDSARPVKGICGVCRTKNNPPKQKAGRPISDAERLARINEHLADVKEVPFCVDPFLRLIIMARKERG
jgi:hypothetical protein